MAKANIKSPTFEYIEGKCLPSAVDGVIKGIQEHMMDEMRDSRQPKKIPNMPKQFLCSKVIDEREKMITIAGEDLPEDQSQKLNCYQIFIPFEIRPHEVETHSLSFAWSGNVISFCQISEDNPEFVAVKIKGNLAKVKNYSTGERDLKFFRISKEERDELPSLTLKQFLQSPLVVEEPASQCLISSYKLTISWLRSRLHKALNTYREIEKDVEVIATIKQKTDGPLFLRLHVEETNTLHKEQVTEYDALLAISPAFRVSPCQLAIPVVSKFHDIPLTFHEMNVDMHCLWKIITKCGESFHEHATASVIDMSSELTLSKKNVKESEEKSEKPVTDEKSLYKKSIDKVRQMTPSQRQQCEMCQNPSSRMLLDYYYQHGYIPDDEMSDAYSFVWEILSFLERSVKADQKPNGPQILEFLESGSVPEKLKVVQPDEFDVMIRIDLPRSTDGYNFVFDKSFPTGFAICQVEIRKSFSRGLKRCFRKSDEFGYCLAPEQLAFGWLYGKLERAINEYKNLEETSCKANLKLRRSGPALLLEITPTQLKSKLPQVISVDLVLALKLSKDDSRYAVAKRAKEEHFYKMMAKKLKSTDEKGLPNSKVNSPVDSEKGNLNSACSSQNETNPSRIQVQDEKVKSCNIDCLPNDDEQLDDSGFSNQGENNPSRIQVQDEKTKSSIEDDLHDIEVKDDKGSKHSVYSYQDETDPSRILVQHEKKKSSSENCLPNFDAKDDEKLENSACASHSEIDPLRSLVQDEKNKCSSENGLPSLYAKDDEKLGNSACASHNETDPSTSLAEDGNMKSCSENSLPSLDDNDDEKTADNTKESGRKNLKYLWRISYSAEEKQYLEDVRKIQRKENVNGCQEICLMVLKTICTREILKQEESVICHKLSSYILKTALFHVLSKSDLIHDWKMDCLADRYVDLLDELSNWRDLPHFFFDNASYLRKFFPEADWCKSTDSKNLLSELHATLKIQLFDRFSQIARSFKKFKNAMDKKCEKEVQPVQFAESHLAYHAILSDILGKQVAEEVIHPPFHTLMKLEEESRRLLIAEEAEDIRVGKAAKTERKSGSQSDASRNLRRAEATKKAKDDYEAWFRELDDDVPLKRIWNLLNSVTKNLHDPDEV